MKALHVGLVAPGILGITVVTGRVEYGRQLPYVKDAEDRIDEAGHQRTVWRDGAFLGWLVGEEGALYYTPDRALAQELDISLLQRPDSYTISSARHAAYRAGLNPIRVSRKTKPEDYARTAPWEFAAPLRHVIYLHLPEPLEEGADYRISFASGFLAEESFLFEPKRMRSEAIHVNHVGFRPDDPAKVAFLSCWLGDGGPLEYAPEMEFSMLEGEKTRFRGRLRLAKARGDLTEDAYNRNYSGTDVYEMDFSALRRKGTFRVYVPGVGCSYPFRIGEEVWREAFRVSARGFYHQRSGIALGPPYTDFRRPRCFHPGDGLRVLHSTAALMDTGNGLTDEGGNFGNLNEGRTDEPVPGLWGGLMDAGDWDRRIQHLEVTRLLLDLAGLFPKYFGRLNLNIPESLSSLPDVVEEALFNLDFYRRCQEPEGGVRGGIESAEHPRHGEGSWQESLAVMAYAPGVWSSYLYAGSAARAALILAGRDSGRADEYRESAVRAYQWAEREMPKRAGKKDHHAVADSRNLAAAELFRLTGEEAYHRTFLDTTAFAYPEAELFVWDDHDQRSAAWVYLLTPAERADPAVRENCLNALLREADERVASVERTGFRWAKYRWAPVGWGGLSAPDGVSLARAHFLTGEGKYLKALALACQTGLGANPVNMCYTTGLGHDWPRHPLHIDSRITHQEPPPGLLVFGPADTQRQKGQWAQELVKRFCHPAPEEWPTIEAYFDVFWYPAVCEYTVMQPMAPAAYCLGYLAARK